MAKKLQVYKCERCGNIVEVLHGGVGTLVCCNEPMKLLEEQTADASTEKHVPVIEKVEGGYRVKVGSVPHPMEEEHCIEWIQLLTDGGAYRQFLKAGDEPEAMFEVTADKVSAREFCNVHGLWKGE
jgi:superoxide reductase